MTRFTFKFESLLKHREAKEDGAQRELAKSLRQRMILQQQVQHMQRAISGSKQQLSDGLVGPVDVNSVTQFARYSGQVGVRAQQIIIKLAQVEKDIQGKRAALVEAMKARKAVALLRDRHFQAWQREQQRREILALDEIGAQQHHQRLLMEAVT